MKIIVCVKGVSSNCISIKNEEANRNNIERLSFIINPYDLHAIEEALRMKDHNQGSTVTVISMGPPAFKESLRQIYYLSIDEAILLCANVFAGADTLATGYTLQKAIEKLGRYDLIICGQMTVDGDTGQVIPMLGSKLGIPFLTNISQIIEVKENNLVCKRQTDYNTQIVEAQLPIIISVQKCINEPRTASLRLYSKNKNKEVTIWQPQDIDADANKCGQLGSGTVVLKTDKVEHFKNCEYIEGQGMQAIDIFSEKLISEGISIGIRLN